MIHRSTGAWVLAACVALLLAGCDGHAGHGASHGDAGGLQLDDGRRWQADDSTRTAIDAMEIATSAEPEPTVDAYRSLGAELQQRNGELISGCTMSGPAHDNLHAFLGHFIPALDALAEAASIDEGRGALAEVRRLLGVYRAHFE